MEKVKVPVRELISKAYAARRRSLIDPKRANPHPTPGEPLQADTIYLTVVDKDFNCVSLIQSNFHGFGSFHVPGDLGFPLQNRGCLFALDETHANRLEPRKRPFHTIIPAFITRDGKPWLSFGLMGGDMQAQGHVQVICNMIDFGMDVQEAGDAARFRHFGSSEPTGQPAEGGGFVSLESEIGPDVRQQLREHGPPSGESRSRQLRRLPGHPRRPRARRPDRRIRPAQGRGSDGILKHKAFTAIGTCFTQRRKERPQRRKEKSKLSPTIAQLVLDSLVRELDQVHASDTKNLLSSLIRLDLLFASLPPPFA